VVTGFGVAGDGLRQADRLAELAGDAALFPVRIAAQRMLAAEAGRQRALLVRVVQRRLRLEEILQAQTEPFEEVDQQEVFDGAGIIDLAHVSPQSPSGPRSRQALRIWQGTPRSRPSPATSAGRPSSRSASAGRSGSAARWP